MSTMVWDETGARYFETGVSRGILFPMTGPGVPWNGLVAVNIDPVGGEAEPYYFDGVKYMERMLAEEFQATVQALHTPKEFEPCEGVRTETFGMKTYFHKRDKFNMAWRTQVGNDLDQNAGYKLHIAYNCMVQPAAKAYQTIADTTALNPRSFVITTTPACGRHSYYTFESLESDLTDLEALLLAGTLPKCWELAALVGPPAGGGEEIPSDPDAGCPVILEDFQSYNPGQSVDDDKLTSGDTIDTYIWGKINNGFDIVELPAVGAFAANDSAASEEGTGDILADDDDLTYITSVDGDLGYTVGLPPLVGYVEGCRFELHIRMSVSGDVNEDDPDNIDADAQVHISTDATGDDTVGGFSDGTDAGMGFAITLVDGTPVDYVVPLDLSAWVDTDLATFVAALEAGAYLNVVAVYNNNFSTTPEVRVYEAEIVMVNNTETSKSLRVITPDDSAWVEHHIYDAPAGSDLVAACTYEVDFVCFERAGDVAYQGFQQDPMTDENFVLMCSYDEDGDGDNPIVQWFDGDVSASVPVAEFNPVFGVWYHAVMDKSWDSVTMKITNRESMEVLVDDTHANSTQPKAHMKFEAGYIGNGDASKGYEMFVDNAKIQVHCNDEAPPPEEIFIDVPLTRARLTGNVGGTDVDEFIDLPDAWPVTFEATIGGAVPPYPSMFLYPVDWDGVTIGGGNEFIPTPPEGYEIADCRFAVKGHTTGGSVSAIGVDTSGWGYHPNPTTTPYLVSSTSFSPCMNGFGTDDPGEWIEGAAWLLSNDQYQGNLHFEHWYSPTPPPWYSVPVKIVMTEWVLRFRCVQS